MKYVICVSYWCLAPCGVNSPDPAEDVIYLGWSGWRGGNFKLWKAQIWKDLWEVGWREIMINLMNFAGYNTYIVYFIIKWKDINEIYEYIITCHEYILNLLHILRSSCTINHLNPKHVSQTGRWFWTFRSRSVLPSKGNGDVLQKKADFFLMPFIRRVMRIGCIYIYTYVFIYVYIYSVHIYIVYAYIYIYIDPWS